MTSGTGRVEVLIVEDDDGTRRALARDLELHGYRVEQAGDGRTALARWELRRPDLVLIDLGLPDMDGLRIVRLTVEDGGPGVPDADLERVFEKFYRVTRRGPAAKAGSGVGLAVVRGFAEAMGARVSARRSELDGLAVDLELPVAAPATGDPS